VARAIVRNLAAVNSKTREPNRIEGGQTSRSSPINDCLHLLQSGFRRNRTGGHRQIGENSIAPGYNGEDNERAVFMPIDRALTKSVGKWRKRDELESSSDPEDVAKPLLSFFHGFIVQSGLLGELDPETVTRGMKGLLGEGVAAKRDIHARSSTRMPSSRK